MLLYSFYQISFSNFQTTVNHKIMNSARWLLGITPMSHVSALTVQNFTWHAVILKREVILKDAPLIPLLVFMIGSVRWCQVQIQILTRYKSLWKHITVWTKLLSLERNQRPIPWHGNATHDMVVLILSLFVLLFSRESVIDKRIESAVSQMQSVIELGRVIRDRKTLPVKVNHQFYTTHSYTPAQEVEFTKTPGNRHYICWYWLITEVTRNVCTEMPKSCLKSFGISVSIRQFFRPKALTGLFHSWKTSSTLLVQFCGIYSSICLFVNIKKMKIGDFIAVRCLYLSNINVCFCFKFQRQSCSHILYSAKNSNSSPIDSGGSFSVTLAHSV